MAPPDAATRLLAFVNTRVRGDDGAWTLDTPALAGWLGDRCEPVTDADAATAGELRAALVALLLAHAGHDDPAALAAAEEHLRRCGRSYPLTAVVTVGGVELVPAQDGVAGRFGGLLAAVDDLVRRDAWTRVKACRNPPCGLGFYDRTRNLSARYCDPRTCGARVAARAYRDRRSTG
ncbi:CGNR zinc finger domain-containing protein [Umezawaea sp. NPDC059074]|uniref:CGNR zinc finger domain-containing protein n=1 Tax=Umezawaea sp. NPDC059074 TaxID=3346716 RepID=UPI0036C1601F